MTVTSQTAAVTSSVDSGRSLHLPTLPTTTAHTPAAPPQRGPPRKRSPTLNACALVAGCVVIVCGAGITLTANVMGSGAALPLNGAARRALGPLAVIMDLGVIMAAFLYYRRVCDHRHDDSARGGTAEDGACRAVSGVGDIWAEKRLNPDERRAKRARVAALFVTQNYKMADS